jgi:hypothetical protein
MLRSELCVTMRASVPFLDLACPVQSSMGELKQGVSESLDVNHRPFSQSLLTACQSLGRDRLTNVGESWSVVTSLISLSPHRQRGSPISDLVDDNPLEDNSSPD